MTPRDRIRSVVLSLLARAGPPGDLGDGDPLLTSGRLQSLDVIEIVTHLESEHGLDFEDYVFDPDDFESVDSIVALVESDRH